MESSGNKLTFSDRDYHEVCQSLRNLRRVDLIALGTVLGLTYPTMSSGDDFLSRVVAAWLNRQDSVLSQSGEPSWSVLADKLEEIGHVEVAAEIRRNDKGPQNHDRGESEQVDENPPAIVSSDSLMDNQLSSTHLDASCSSDLTTTHISIQPMTWQDQPHSSVSLTYLEQPPAAKRTKLDQQSRREESSSQQLLYATSREQNLITTYTYTVGKMLSPIVTVPTAVEESFRHHPSSQAQPTYTGKGDLQSAVLPQSMNPTLPPPPTLSCSFTTTSTTNSALPHQTGTVTLPIVLSSHNHPSHALALQSAGVQDSILTESIRAEAAGEAFREHRTALLIAVTDPLILGNSLYSSRMISRETLDRVKLPTLTSTEKNMEIFDAIESQIKINPVSFSTLLDILSNDSQLQIFAGRLQQSYDQICGSNLRDALEPTNLTATRQLNGYLMDIYRSLPQSCGDMKFPHLPEKKFITLAVIEKELVSRVNADTFTKGTLHGHADEILKKKKPIDMETVLEPPEGQQKNLKCIFVEGAPGVGKSTFALEFCRMQGKLGLYLLTLLLRLREKHVQGIKNVNDLFYQNADLQQAVTKEIVACKGKNVLFVLDGFDELPIALRRDSFLLELIQGKHLPECTVLVTSRPSATADLHFSCKRQIHKHIEILGFTHDHIRKYAESMLSDQPDVLQDFLKYISKNPAIHGMMYIPLNSAIVLQIYKFKRTSDKPVPCSVTQLYIELCLILLRKHLSETNDPLMDQLLSTRRLGDIPDALREKVLKLGELALEGALRQQITFDQLPDGCADLGFMNISTEFYVGTKSMSYTFLHLTLQEFLAAFYISQLPSVEQKLLLIENSLSKNMWSRNSHLDVLWRFMAGLTGFKDVGWEFVGKIMQGKVLLVHCLLELQSKQMIKSACDIIMKEKEERNTGAAYPLIFDDTPIVPTFHVTGLHTPFDCYALGYCVAASGHKWDFELERVGGNEIIEMLSCGLQSNRNMSGYFSDLNLAKNSLTYQGVAILRDFPSNILSQICKLNLASNQLNNDAFNCLALVLSHMINLTYLDLSCNPGCPGGMVQLFHNLSNTKVKEFAVYKINLGISDIQALTQLLRLNVNLKRLSIGDKNMSSECVALMVETLLSSSLNDLQLWWISYTPSSACSWKALENNTNLKYLKLINNLDGVNLALPYIAKALHMNGSLSILEITIGTIQNDNQFRIDYRFGYDIGIDSVKTLSEMLKVNKTLFTVEIPANKLTRDEVMILSDALKENTTLQYLCLHPDTIAKTVIIDKRILSIQSD